MVDSRVVVERELAAGVRAGHVHRSRRGYTVVSAFSPPALQRYESPIDIID